MMARFRVLCGEYEIIVNEETIRRAADLAIQRHDQSNNTALLGPLTLIQKLDGVSDPYFIATNKLIKDNANGLYKDSSGVIINQPEENL